MRRGVEIAGSKPDDDWNNIAVSQKSIPPQSVGPAVVSGPTAVRVLFQDQRSLDYPFAIPIEGRSDCLLASPFGKNRILWRAEPETEILGCEGVILQAFANMGDDGQWVWFKLEEDLDSCSGALARLVNECGNELGDCPIVKTVYAPKTSNLCGCEEEGSGWKAGDVLPFWWFQYLEKRIAIPNQTGGFKEKEAKLLSGGTFENLQFELEGEDVTVVEDVELKAEYLALETSLTEVGVELEGDIEIEGALELTEDVEVEGDLTLQGTLKSELNFNASVGIDLNSDATMRGRLELEGDVELTSKEIITDVEFQAPTLKTEEIQVPIYSAGTFSGALKEDGATITRPVTVNVSQQTLTIPSVPERVATGVELNVENLKYEKAKATVDLSQLKITVKVPRPVVDELEVVTSVRFLQDECRFEVTTATAQIVTGWEEFEYEATLNGEATLDFETASVFEEKTDETLTVSTESTGATTALVAEGLTATVEIPCSLSGAIALGASDHVTVKSVESWETGACQTKTETVSLPTSGKVNLEAETTFSGALSVSGGSCSLTGFSLPIEEEITLSGPAELKGKASNRDGSITIGGEKKTRMSGAVVLPLPTGVYAENALEVKKTTIQKIEAATGSGTFNKKNGNELRFKMRRKLVQLRVFRHNQSDVARLKLKISSGHFVFTQLSARDSKNNRLRRQLGLAKATF